MKVAAAESEVDNVDEYFDSDERVEDDQQRSELALKEVMDEKDEPAALVEGTARRGAGDWASRQQEEEGKTGEERRRT